MSNRIISLNSNNITSKKLFKKDKIYSQGKIEAANTSTYQIKDNNIKKIKAEDQRIEKKSDSEPKIEELGPWV